MGQGQGQRRCCCCCCLRRDHALRRCSAGHCGRAKKMNYLVSERPARGRSLGGKREKQGGGGCMAGRGAPSRALGGWMGKKERMSKVTGEGTPRWPQAKPLGGHFCSCV